jgi:TRAP-type C4-dicarboxylate transport system permease large subunit
VALDVILVGCRLESVTLLRALVEAFLGPLVEALGIDPVARDVVLVGRRLGPLVIALLGPLMEPLLGVLGWHVLLP